MKKRRQVPGQKTKPSKTAAQSPPTGQPIGAQEAQVNSAVEEGTRPFLNRRWVRVVALVCVAVLGLWVRLEDLVPWKREPAKAFYNGEPLLTALDGLFYLTLARDLLEGSYHPVDEKRAVPDSPPRPDPPPLISVLTAGMARLLPISINWVAVLLPALLGVLIVWPLYGLGGFFGGPAAGVAAALMAVLPPYYVYRSGLGWLDTDALNVTFAASAAYLFLKFGVTPGLRRYCYFAGGLVTYALFLWWWDQTPHVVTAICVVPLAVALAFFYRPKGRERWFFLGTFGAGLLILLLAKGMALISQTLGILEAQFSYISKETAGPFPNIGVSISEQVRPTFETMVTLSSGHILTFLTAVCGFVWLVRRHWKESLFLAALVCLSALAFLYARRFAIFCVPVVALGTGFLISELWRLRSRFWLLTYATPCFIAVLLWPMLAINHGQTYWPKEQPPIVSGLAAAEKKTPPDAVIWAWWDHGYTIPYWARRASVNDGSVHSGERTFFNGMPLATDDERLAANFMHFYVVRGIPGMEELYAAMGDDQAKGFALLKRILAAGPDQARTMLAEVQLPSVQDRSKTEDWLEFFFPTNPRPVYLLLDDLLTRTSYWWFWFGTWDIDKHDGRHVDYRLFTNMYEENGVLKAKEGGIEIDTRTGRVDLGNQVVPLEELTFWDGTRLQSKQFNTRSGIVFEVSAQTHLGAMMHRDIAPSVFNKLYLRQAFSPQYFRPVIQNAPWHQLWEVKGDSWKGGKEANQGGA